MTNQEYLDRGKDLLNQLIDEELKSYRDKLYKNCNRINEMLVIDLEDIFLYSKGRIVSFINSYYQHPLKGPIVIQGHYLTAPESLFHWDLSSVANKRFSEFHEIRDQFLAKHSL